MTDYPRANNHKPNCDWYLDQYDWECTCGAVKDPDQFKPRWLKAPAEPTSNPTSSK